MSTSERAIDIWNKVSVEKVSNDDTEALRTIISKDLSTMYLEWKQMRKVANNPETQPRHFIRALKEFR